MKIQYASDLHLEFADNWRYLKENPLQVTGDILVLAGDIGYLGDENYSKHPFWDWASENYQQVIVCMGNHEFYKYYDIAKLNDGFCLEIRPNVHSYYNAVVRIEDIDFWIYGHSHYNVDVRIGNTMCISNQLGYVFHGEHEFFDPCKNIEV